MEFSTSMYFTKSFEYEFCLIINNIMNAINSLYTNLNLIVFTYHESNLPWISLAHAHMTHSTSPIYYM